MTAPTPSFRINMNYQGHDRFLKEDDKIWFTYDRTEADAKAAEQTQASAEAHLEGTPVTTFTVVEMPTGEPTE